MTETVVDYITRTTVRLQPKRCPGCTAPLGTVVDSGAQFHSGALLITSVRGACAKCGHPITWFSTDRHIESITREAKARKVK